jgi:hypothetical protein
MDVKSSIESLGIIVGIIATAYVISGQRGWPRASEVDNVPIQAPINYLGRQDVQAQLARVRALPAYRDYSTWKPGRGGL